MLIKPRWALGWILVAGALSLALPSPGLTQDGEDDIPVIVLEAEDSAPVVDLDVQVGFGGRGAGPVPGCLNANQETYRYGDISTCIVDFSFAYGTEVAVTHYRPDGTIHTQYTTIAEFDEGGTAGYAVADIPTDFPLPVGEWRVELRAGSISNTFTYTLRDLDQPGILPGCDGPHPVLNLTGFAPHTRTPLALVYLTDTAATPDGLGMVEDYRWVVEVSERGQLRAFPGFPVVDRGAGDADPLSAPYFVLPDPLQVMSAAGDPIFLDMLPDIGLSTGQFPWGCHTSSSVAQARQAPLDVPRLATGATAAYANAGQYVHYYALAGQRGDVITAHAVSPHGHDLALRLLDANNRVIAENDNAATPRFGPLDAAIVNFTLPADGWYTFAVSPTRAVEGYTTQLLVEEGDPNATSTPAVAQPYAFQPRVCPESPPPRLVVGEPARVTPGPANNLRSWPGADSRQLGQIPGGESFTVLSGPVCADGLLWWQVDYSGRTGWTAAGQGDTYWVEPAR